MEADQKVEMTMLLILPILRTIDGTMSYTQGVFYGFKRFLVCTYKYFYLLKYLLKLMRSISKIRIGL